MVLGGATILNYPYTIILRSWLPELWCSDVGARYGTQTDEGTKAIDTFMSLVSTTRKLGLSFFEYVRDRISATGTIPSVAALIRIGSSHNPFGWSWQPE